MRKIFVALIILSTILIGGCGESIGVVNTDNEIHVTAENVTNSETNTNVKLDGIEILFGEAKIEKGTLDIKIGDKTYSYDKTQEISIELPAGEHEIIFSGHDKFTGEVTLKPLPKI